VGDASGSVVPGADVTVTEVHTNVVVRKVLSDENGNYEVPGVKPGTYQVKAELPGFKTYVVDNVVLEGSQIRRVDMTLQVGEVTEQVTVTGGAAVITTDSASISSGFDSKLFEVAPLVRTYYPQALMATLPGIESQAGSFSLRIAGQPPAQAAEGMDGVTNDGTVNLINNMLNFEELTVVAVNNRADQARVANFNMVSKRGTNALHGTASYTHFNSALNARGFFEPKKPVLIEHRGQADVSGPIFKNKTFFYVSYFHQKLPAGSFNRSTVPTLLMRSGNFSQFSRPVLDPITGQPFSGNVIPATRINETSQKIQQAFIPNPNLGGPGALTNNLGFAHPYPDDLFRADYPMFRIDHTFSEKNSIYGRYIRRYTPYVLKRGLPGFDYTRVRWHRGTALSDTHVFTPALVNNFIFGWLWDFVEDGTTVDGFTPRRGDEAVQQIGLQGVNPRNLRALGFPRINITGLTSLETVAGGVKQDDHTLSFSDSVTWALGRHVYKFGADFKRLSRFSGEIREGTYGRFGFNGSLSGHAYADFLLGLPFSSERLDPLTDRTQVAREFGIYAMDTWKVTQNLVLDYGIRWDYFGAPFYQDGLQYNWDRNTGNVIVPQEALKSVSPLYPKTIAVVTGKVKPDSQLSSIRPRIGFAYRWRNRSVIRGGYGVFTEQVGYFDRLQGGGPFEIAETYFNAVENGQPRFAFPNPFPGSLAAATVASQSVRGYPNRTHNGAIHQFNLSVEQQIGSIGLRASYIGSRSRDLNYSLNINKPRPSTTPFTASRRPFPQFVTTTWVLDDGASNYDSAQFEVQRKMGAITFNAHYTLQSSLSNFLNLENPFDLNHWNREQFASRHKFVISSIIELPVGRGRRYLADVHPAVDQVLGGWKLITLSHLQSGQYFSPAFSGADPSRTNTLGGLPDRIADGNLPPSQRKVERWFDAAAFVAPQVGRFGNSGVNILEGPGIHLHHLSLVKNFKIHERFNLEYFTGISNLFNHPHFRFPRTDISAAEPGVINSARSADQDQNKAGPRMIEMTLRLRW